MDSRSLCNSIKWGVLRLTLTLATSGCFGVLSQAGAATVTVTSTADTADGNTTSIAALITTPGPDGKISLREAILAANNTAGADTINFNIIGSGVKTIFLQTVKLPPITDTVTIDGYTQPGASPNTLAVGDDAVLLIQVTGNILPVGQLGTGLQLDADNCVIQGLVINQFSGSTNFPPPPNDGAIVVHGNGNVIAGNFIGTNAAGTVYAQPALNPPDGDRTNQVGLSISGSSSGNTTIGGTTPAARNIITGNATAINIQNSSGNVVAGNYIGTDIHGVPMIWNVAPIWGSLDGPIRIFGASNTTIGGTAAGAGNLTTVGVNLINDAVTSPPTVFVPHNNLILGNSFLSDWRNLLGSNIQFVATPTFGDSDYNSGGANVSQDTLDADTGPNGLQNSPSILSATISGVTTSVSLRLTTAANQTYRVEVYSDAVLNGLGTGNGRTLLGTTSLTTDASGVAQTSLALPAVAAGQWISAIASGPDGTSEFSVAHLVQDPVVAGLPLVVTNTNDSGAGSLRQAILNANAMINGPTPDVITFNIPGAGVHTIQPASDLPVIGEGVFIDGYSQPGSSVNTLATGNNAVLQIELSGASLSATPNILLAVLGSDTTIRGLIMNQAAGSSGSGTTLALMSLASNAKVEGNFIGTNAAGTAAAANPGSGVRLDNVSNSSIGGTAPAARNLISGNGYGVFLRGPETTGNLIAGNSIGTDAAGTAAIPNTVYGIRLGPYVANNLIGGTTAGARNLISGNGAGISAASNYGGSLYTLGDDNRIEGNYIGTSADGNAALGNGTVGQNTTGGILISDLTLGSGTLTIGGTAAGAGNLISGNKGSGIVVMAYDFSPPSGTVVIQGNLIGTNTAGTAANPNLGDGIFQDFFTLPLVVGGTSAAARNIISGNRGNGIAGGSYYGTALIQGNYIGTDITGSQPLGNGKHGILASATGAQIGDPATTDGGNLIAFNTLNGIAVTGDVGNRISRNRIFSNGVLGIDLGSDGVTLNDVGDPDTGPNNLQNFPVLLHDLYARTVQGTLNSTPNTVFRIDLFSNAACDPSGHAQGQTYLGFTTVTTDGGGYADFGSLNFPLPASHTVFTATATDPANNTSEFSACSQLGSNDSLTTSTTSMTRLESPPACTPIGSSRRVETVTLEESIGPVTIFIGDRDTGGTAFLVPSEWTNLNVNTHTDIFQCVATASTAPTQLTISSINGGADPTLGIGFSVVVQAQDGGSTPQNVAANTVVTLSLLSGTGTLGGTTGCTIVAGSNSCTVTGVSYSVAEAGIRLTATRTGGDTLSAGNSAVFSVNAVLASVAAIPSLSEMGLWMLAALVGLLGMARMRPGLPKV